MPVTPRDPTREILRFWFEGDGAVAPGTHRRVWFRQSDDFDADVRERFLADHHAAAKGALDDLAARRDGALALILLLDQVPRNLFRNSPQAFATDAKALKIAEAALKAGFDHGRPETERTFFYLPFQHAESVGVQRRAVDLFKDFDRLESVKAAEDHLRVIKRFGRFPHRNEVLRRASTAEERTFLTEHGRGF